MRRAAPTRTSSTTPLRAATSKTAWSNIRARTTSATPRSSPRTAPGSSAPSSTRCWCGRSTTPTPTGRATCAGLTEQLDYLQWLGVDCLWLPPFYDSPLRDGGYDIRDFYKVLPEFGTVDDFVALLDAAHRRGIRVITDLVMNHTSDSHPWFQESRRDPDGPVRRLLRVERHQRAATPTPGSSSSTPRSRTGPSTRCAGSSTGTGSSPTSPTSTTTTRPCRRRCSTCCGSGWTSASTASGWTRCPTCSSARAPTARTCPRRTRSSSTAAR